MEYNSKKRKEKFKHKISYSDDQDVASSHQDAKVGKLLVHNDFLNVT
jgi:hypothetical protein